MRRPRPSQMARNSRSDFGRMPSIPWGSGRRGEWDSGLGGVMIFKFNSQVCEHDFQLICKFKLPTAQPCHPGRLMTKEVSQSISFRESGCKFSGPVAKTLCRVHHLLHFRGADVQVLLHSFFCVPLISLSLFALFLSFCSLLPRPDLRLSA